MTQTACQTVIDWAATGSMLQGIGTFGGVGAVVWGAMFGADLWRRQKQAERLSTAAERVLTATYKGRRALEAVRSPFMQGYEQSVAEEKLKQDPTWWASQPKDRQKRLITTQAYFNRLDQTQDEQRQLDECLPLARALFGEELEKAVDQLRHQFWLVHVDAESFADDNGSDAAFTKDIREGLYSSRPKGGANKRNDAIAALVDLIEGTCLPVLRLDQYPTRPSVSS